MVDDKNKTGKADSDRINVDEEYELRDWSKKLHVTPEQLTAAVAAVGPIVENVRRYLKK
jgi:hypothetical protein